MTTKQLETLKRAEHAMYAAQDKVREARRADETCQAKSLQVRLNRRAALRKAQDIAEQAKIQYEALKAQYAN